MKKLFLLTLIIVKFAHAEVDSKVMIRGTIGGTFDDEKVLIKDNLGQNFYLPRHVFPKDIVVKQGQEFNIEVPEKDISQVKPYKK